MKGCKFLLLVWLSTFVSIAVPHLTAAPGISKVADVQMTYSGLPVVSYGGYLNGESFQQDGILTYNGYQYTCFWNIERRVILARRRLPDGQWQKIEISDYTNSANDAHNTISLGVSPSDGTLHVAFDHHGDDLHYIRSVSELVTNPDVVPWAKSSFNHVSDRLGNTFLTEVTYPRFITTPNGNMLFEYRYGASGNGDQRLFEYTGYGRWTEIGTYINGISDGINAYPHGLEYRGNRLHMTWSYRSSPNAATNFNLYYIYSDDDGRTWKNNAGFRVAVTGSSPVRRSTEGIRVWSIPQNRGLINQEHMTVDHMGRVHVLLSHMSDTQSDDTNFVSARRKSEFFHYWRNTDGIWSRNSLGLGVIKNFRGKLAVSPNNDLYAILPNIRIMSASAEKSWNDWTLINTQDSGRFFSDPLIDISRLHQEGTLTVYAPQANSTNIYTLDYNFTPDSGESSGIVSGATYKITVRHSGKSLDIDSSNNNLMQYDYWGGDNQQFVVTNVGSGYYRISPLSATDYGLDVNQQSTEDGANVQIWSYWGGANQRWQINDLGNGFYSIINRNSGKSLHVEDRHTTNGANVLQWTYQGEDNQQFAFTRL